MRYADQSEAANRVPRQIENLILLVFCSWYSQASLSLQICLCVVV